MLHRGLRKWVVGLKPLETWYLRKIIQTRMFLSPTETVADRINCEKAPLCSAVSLTLWTLIVQRNIVYIKLSSLLLFIVCAERKGQVNNKTIYTKWDLTLAWPPHSIIILSIQESPCLSQNLFIQIHSDLYVFSLFSQYFIIWTPYSK